MFRTVLLSIIRGFSLYTQQWYRPCRFFWQLASRIRMELQFHLDPACKLSEKSVWPIPLLCVQWKTPGDGQKNSSSILILLASCQKNLKFHPDPACKLLEKPVWHIPLLCVQWKTPDDGQRNSPKHVEFPSKVNLRNWCIWLVYYRKFVTMHGHINVKNIRNPRDLMWTQFTDVMGVNNTRAHVERDTVTPF
jgi:hypothetical protein